MLSIQVSDDLKALEKKKEETRKKVGGIDPLTRFPLNSGCG